MSNLCKSINVLRIYWNQHLLQYKRTCLISILKLFKNILVKITSTQYSLQLMFRSPSGKKLCTEFRPHLLSFYHGFDSRLKSLLDHKSKEKLYKQRVPEPKCTRKETVCKGIFIASMFSCRKVTQPIKTMRDNKNRKNKEFEKILLLHFFKSY